MYSSPALIKADNVAADSDSHCTNMPDFPDFNPKPRHVWDQLVPWPVYSPRCLKYDLWLDVWWLQCGAVITQSIFCQILIKETPLLAREDDLWSVFCEFNLWLSSVPVAAVLYTISCYIGLRYNGTRLYFLLSANVQDLLSFELYIYINIQYVE